MGEKKLFSKPINKRQFIEDYQYIKRRKKLRLLPIIDFDLKMPKEIEKQIILDAIGNYILSCDGKELKEFLKEIEDTISIICAFNQDE